MWRNVSAAALRRHHWAVRIKSHHTHTPHTRADRNHYTPTYISLPHCLITSHLQCRWRRYPAPLRLLSTRPCSDIHAKIFFQMIGTHEKIEFLYQVSKLCRWILMSNTFIPCLKGKLKPEVIIFFGGLLTLCWRAVYQIKYIWKLTLQRFVSQNASSTFVSNNRFQIFQSRLIKPGAISIFNRQNSPSHYRQNKLPFSFLGLPMFEMNDFRNDFKFVISRFDKFSAICHCFVYEIISVETSAIEAMHLWSYNWIFTCIWEERHDVREIA